VEFLPSRAETRSSTSICLRFVAPWFLARDLPSQTRIAKQMTALLEQEGVAFDTAFYRDAPPGSRIWGGATIETSDIQALLPWLDWAYAQVESEHAPHG